MTREQKYRQRNLEKVRARQREYQRKRRKTDEYHRYRTEYQNKNKETLKQKSREFLEKNPTYQRDRHLQYAYGITLERYNEIFSEQKGCCGVCGKHQSEMKQSLVVDHDHQTSVVRGLLCNKCNFMLGLANDDPDILMLGADYLKKWKS